MQGELATVVSELETGEGHVADHRADTALGQPGVAEILDADVLAGVQGLGDPPGGRVQLDADETRPLRGLAHEIARTAAGLQDRGIAGHA